MLKSGKATSDAAFELMASPCVGSSEADVASMTLEAHHGEQRQARVTQFF
jgi:hypothetical protein